VNKDKRKSWTAERLAQACARLFLRAAQKRAT
jgi:hypothetical protein